jgi:cytochrome bd ubiquinol oxidase subunit I
VPARLRAPLPDLIHLSFDLVVGLGMLLLVLSAWQAWFALFRRRLLVTRWFLIPAAASGLGAIAAMEAGWIVTEVGRQPWVVYGYLLTKDAVTPAAGVPVTLAVVLPLYAVLTAVVIGVPWMMGRRWRREDPSDDGQDVAPGPPPELAETPELR